MARKRSGQTMIVPLNEILSPDEIINEENVNLKRLYYQTDTNETVLQWCARRSLIKNKRTCPRCQEPNRLYKCLRAIDGHGWDCRCKSKKTVRDDSFFSHSHLTIQQILTLIYLWCGGTSQHLMTRETGIKKARIVTDWCNSAREVCTVWFENNYEGIGGINEDTGEAIVVEIGKTEYFHRKYHGSHYTEGHCVFGGIERGSGKCFLAVLKNGTAQTLKECITQNILPGTYIVSDEWASYANIDQIHQGIYQYSVNTHNFVDPSDSFIHTQNIKNMWMRAKKRFKKHSGSSETLFMTYLHEFMFRNYYKTDFFQNFLTALSVN